MYNSYFDFRQKPFKLVPNPEFLFLGKSHEEALAHLTYATSQGDGFVEITGEVGTGKTTLCRVFLEDLSKTVEAAFIFNSNLDSEQLLKAVHKELGILSIANGLVELTQDLNDFLLEKKSQGKSVILLIDEAQNLGKETLEQLRLLSNLETTRNKLLQIILVGQPELRDMLDSHEMRQLRQRINLSCHIHPMTQKETFDYITHRVNIASRKPQALFTRKAQKAIYKFSRGIPRLINIACDRSLLAAYSLNRKKVTPSSVKIAVDELDAHRHRQPRSNSIWKKAVLFFSLFAFISCLLYAVFLSGQWEWQKREWRKETKVDKTAVKTLNEPIPASPPLEPAKITEQPNIVRKAVLPETDFPIATIIEKGDAKKILPVIKSHATRENAFLHIDSLWNDNSTIHLNPLTRQMESNIRFFKIAATQHNFNLLYLETHQGLIKTFNLPVILGIALPGDPVKGFIVVDGITPDNEYIISPGTGKIIYKVNPEELLPYLTGDMYIVWKDIFGYDRVVSSVSSEDSIISLKLRLSEIGFPFADMNPVYDSSIKQAIKQIQKKYGLTEDGLVGPFTKIVMLNEQKNDAVPYLDTSRFKTGRSRVK